VCREWVTLFEICILLLSKFLLWYVSAAYAVMWCPSVCLSVTFMDSVEMSKHIFRIFSPPLSTGLPHHSSFSSFPYQTLWQYSDGNPPNEDIECRWGRHKSRVLTNSWLSIDDWWSANNNCDSPPCTLQHRLPCISESLFVTTSMDDPNKERRTEQNLFMTSAAKNAFSLGQWNLIWSLPVCMRW